ncbi:MAG: NmrA family NAD(P)-binding protein, partial [Chloroflexi bacterium]|nr:NmrA family NAD(P)-binding protein [Chloroflexota bacterium]
RLFLVRPPALANVERDIAPALQSAVKHGVKHIVFLSLQGVENNRMVPHHKIEQLLQTLAVQTTNLRASFFMQNLSTTHREEIRDRSEIAVPVGEARTSFIDVRDIAAVAVQALTEAGHEGRNYTITGSQALDYYEVAQILSTELGRPIRYTNPSPARFFISQLEQGTHLSYAAVVTALYTATRMGNAQHVTDDVERILERPAISLAQFAHDYRECWLN